MLAFILTLTTAFAYDKTNVAELDAKCAKKDVTACYDAAMVFWKTGRKEDRLSAKNRFMNACALGNKASCQYASIRDDRESTVRSKNYVQVEKGAAAGAADKSAFEGEEKAVDLQRSKTNPRICRKAKDKAGMTDGFEYHAIKREDGVMVGKIDRLDAFNVYFDLGLRKGDYIVEWNGKVFADANKAGRKLASVLPNAIKIERSKREYVLEADCSGK